MEGISLKERFWALWTGLNPAFVFEILSKGKLLFVRDGSRFIDFKKNVLQYYMDTRVPREMADAAMNARLRSNRFGVEVVFERLKLLENNVCDLG